MQVIKKKYYNINKLIVKENPKSKRGYLLATDYFNPKKVTEKHFEKIIKRNCVFIRYHKNAHFYSVNPIYSLVYTDKKNLKYMKGEYGIYCYTRIYSIHDIRLLNNFIFFN